MDTKKRNSDSKQVLLRDTGRKLKLKTGIKAGKKVKID
jgi:hypothetical protein